MPLARSHLFEMVAIDWFLVQINKKSCRTVWEPGGFFFFSKKQIKAVSPHRSLFFFSSSYLCRNMFDYPDMHFLFLSHVVEFP